MALKKVARPVPDKLSMGIPNNLAGYTGLTAVVARHNGILNKMGGHFISHISVPYKFNQRCMPVC